MLLRITPSLLLAAIAACSISEARVPRDISVELASVTLAEDCNAPTPPPPPQPTGQPPGTFAKPPPGSPARTSRTPVAPSERADCKGSNCGVARGRRACEQTSMQISINAQAGVRPTTIKIKRVELLDSKGKVLQVLNPTVPTRWSQQSGVYVGWDERVDANDIIKASYRLDAPNWNKLTNGRLNAHAHVFQLRVTVTIGNSDRTVEKTSISPARIAPMVVT